MTEETLTAPIPETTIDERDTATLAVLPPSGVSEQVMQLFSYIGDHVRFVLAAGEDRPAVIVRVFAGAAPTANLVVFTDGENDKDLVPERVAQRVPLTIWRTSVHYDPEGKTIGTWRY